MKIKELPIYTGRISAMMHQKKFPPPITELPTGIDPAIEWEVVAHHDPYYEFDETIESYRSLRRWYSQAGVNRHDADLFARRQIEEFDLRKQRFENGTENFYTLEVRLVNSRTGELLDQEFLGGINLSDHELHKLEYGTYVGYAKEIVDEIKSEILHRFDPQQFQLVLPLQFAC